MTINNKSKVTMEAAKSLPELPALQEARRATGDAGNSAVPDAPREADAEVVPRARRRSFTNADKRRILQAAARCTQPGEIGALMRREGVYSSSLSTWRRQREAADLGALAPQKRGPKADAGRADTQQIAQLTRDNDKLQSRLDKALLVIEVQKKVGALLALLEQGGKPGST
jgi:transposase-like protein